MPKDNIKKEYIYPYMLKIAREEVAKMMLAEAIREMLQKEG